MLILVGPAMPKRLLVQLTGLGGGGEVQSCCANSIPQK